MSDQPAKTPLLELLRGVPQDARAVYEHHSTSHQFIPYGRLCREAADILDALRPKQTSEELPPEDLAVKTPNRRERIATVVLAGMCADPDRKGTFENFASGAVQYADALIAELDKPAGREGGE